MLTEIPEVKYIRYICIFERSNEKNNFSKTKIHFHKKTTPQLSGHIGLQTMKVLSDLLPFVWCKLILALEYRVYIHFLLHNIWTKIKSLWLEHYFLRINLRVSDFCEIKHTAWANYVEKCSQSTLVVLPFVKMKTVSRILGYQNYCLRICWKM